MEKQKKPPDKIKYPVYGARIEEELKEWFIQESTKYRSTNLFFRELKKRYIDQSK